MKTKLPILEAKKTSNRGQSILADISAEQLSDFSVCIKTEYAEEIAKRCNSYPKLVLALKNNWDREELEELLEELGECKEYPLKDWLTM